MSKFLKRAAHGAGVPHEKRTSSLETVVMPLPSKIVLSMSQHIGAPAAPTVAKGDQVYVGTVVGKAGGFVSSDIHSGVSGIVDGITTITAPNGAVQTAVVIIPDGEQKVDPSIAPPQVTDLKSFQDAVRASGLVGLGGAGFPAAVKLSPKNLDEIDTLIINGAECEPYITGDHRAMLERPAEIIGGCCYLAKMFGVSKVVIGVEDNKKNGIESLNKVIAEQKAPVVVEALRCRYPQGGEKQLCQAITGKQVPPGGLPANIGCAVFNINTTIAIYHAIKDGMPVVRKVVTVSGSGVVEPKNLECPIGTPVSLLFDACGGLKDETFKLIAGGPMMGMAQASADFPVAKGTGAVLAFAANENKVSEDPTCIRCGRCVEACPMHLEPLYLYLYVQKNRIEDLEAAHVMDCIECGACSYICPGRLHLTHSFKVGKQKVKEAAAKAKAAAEAAKAAEEAKKEA